MTQVTPRSGWAAGFRELIARAFLRPATGPFIALMAAVLIFTILSDGFLAQANVSLMLRQAVVVGTLALGQTLIILVAGIDLSNGAIAVLGTVLMAKTAMEGNALLSLLIGVAAVIAVSGLNGLITTKLKLPAFIVTLGMLAIVQAGTRIYADSQSFPVTSPLLTVLGNNVGGMTVGSIVFLAVSALLWYVLIHTTWGRHVYAVGDNPTAARLNGINVDRILISVYVVAGIFYALAAWQALGRLPNADANSYQTANLDSITAVVIGGTSLFGGRGSVLGTVIGALIVVVLRSGLTKLGIDALYQDLATGVLVILAVLIDQTLRRKR